MSKHAAPDPQIQGKALGNVDPNRRGRGGDPAIGQPQPGKHSGGM